MTEKGTDVNMISPSQMKNKSFTVSLRGYTKSEVDTHIDALVEQYTELYRAYSSLAEQNNELKEEIKRLRENEDSIRRALINSQNAASLVLDNAKERGEQMEQSARQACEEVLAIFHEKTREERERLNILRTQVKEFKNRVFAEYHEHIQSLERVTKSLDEGDWDVTPTDATRAVLARLRGDFERRTRAEADAEEKLDEEIGELLDKIADGKENNS